MCKWTLQTLHHFKAHESGKKNSGYERVMALKMILTVDINVINLGHILQAYVTPFSILSDLQIKLVVILVLQFSLKLPTTTVAVSLTGLIYVMSWEYVKNTSIQ